MYVCKNNEDGSLSYLNRKSGWGVGDTKATRFTPEEARQMAAQHGGYTVLVRSSGLPRRCKVRRRRFCR